LFEKINFALLLEVREAKAAAVLAMICEEQLPRKAERRRDRAPRRGDQHNARLFKLG
jgi:hypothetical protein